MNGNNQPTWECFLDPSYFDMWAVKQISNQRFDEAYHVTSEVEARRLCALLNTSADLNTTPSQPAVPQDMRMVPASLLEELESSLYEFGQGRCFTSIDMDRYKRLGEVLSATPVSPSQEPMRSLTVPDDLPGMWDYADLSGGETDAALSKGPVTLTDEQIRLPDPFCYLCDWGDYGGLPRQIAYFGEPGSGVDDDWNEVPKVHHNKPMYTEEQVRAIIAKVKGVE